MSLRQASENQDREEQPAKQPTQAGSTRFRNADYAEQREHWPDEDDRR